MQPAGPAVYAAPAAPGAAARGRVVTAAQAKRRRVDAATALFVVGCAAAVLALFVMTVDTTNSRLLGTCAPTDEEAADLRAASELLLLAAAAQLLGATTARYTAAWPFSLFACALAFPTSYRAYVVLRMVVGCHGHVAHSATLAVHFWAVIAVLGAAVFVAMLGAVRGCCYV